MRESNAVDREGDFLLFYSEYNPDFVIAIKATIPVLVESARRIPEGPILARIWDPLRFCWVVHIDYVEVLLDLIAEHMGITIYL